MRHPEIHRTRGFARCAAGLLLAASFLVAVPPAFADLVLRVTNLAAQETIGDGTADDQCPVPGCVAFSGSIGDFPLAVVTGTSAPILPATLFAASMSLTMIIVGGGVSTLSVELTDTDFPATEEGFLTANVSGTTPGTVGASAHKNASNEEFDTTNAITVDLGLVDPEPNDALARNGSTLHGPLGPYSMTLQVALTPGFGTSVVFLNATNAIVPEPSTLVILGLGLAGAGTIARRRRMGR